MKKKKIVPMIILLAVGRSSSDLLLSIEKL